MLKYYINILMFFSFGLIWAQNEEISDSLSAEEFRYGIRFGIDLSKPIRMLIEPEYKGLELVADYRLSRNLYVAAEFGNESKLVDRDAVSFKTSGSFLKVGIDYNVYNNWRGMDNLIVVGLRYGLSDHKQSLLGYSVLESNPYWEESNLVNLSTPRTYNGLNGHWIELQLGVKAELLRNLFMGISIQMHLLLSDKDPDNFENLFIPGFNKVLTDNVYVAVLNYSISYQLPMYKK